MQRQAQPIQIADLDQSTLTDPNLLRKYLIQNKAFINPAFLKNIKRQLGPYQQVEHIPYQQLMSLLTIADPDELQECLYNKNNLIADPRLIAMLRDEAEALKSLRNDEKIKTILDNQQLAVGAFQPVSEIKMMANDYRKIYGDEKLIQYYDNPSRPINKDKKQRDRKEPGISGNGEFEKQFNTLLNKLGDWNHTAASKAAFNKLREILFTSGYSGNQEDEYFSALKDKLEKMYLLLNEEKIPLEYRKTVYQELYPTIGYACSPGLPTHVANYLNQLKFSLNCSIEAWLAVLRTEHIKGYANKLNPKIFIGDQKQFEAGYDVHTTNSMIEYANQHGWNAVLDLDDVREVHKGKNIKPEHYIELKKYLEKSYTIESICESIANQIQKTIDDKIDGEKLEKLTNHWTYGTREYCNWLEGFIKGIFKDNILIPTLFEMESERKGEPMDTPISTKVNTAYLQGYIIQYVLKNNIIDRDYFNKNKLILKSKATIYLPSFIPPPLDIKTERNRFERWTYLADEDLTELLAHTMDAKHDEKGQAAFKDEFIHALYDHAIALGKKETISFLHKKKFSRNELFYIREEGEEILNSAPKEQKIKMPYYNQELKKIDYKEQTKLVEYRIYDSSRLKSLDRKIYERLPEQHAVIIIKRKFQNECKSNPKFMSEMALHAVEAHKPSLLKTLFELKPDLINQIYHHSFADEKGFFKTTQINLIQKAAIHGAWQTLETLLEYKTNSTDAIALAVKYNRKETSRILLKKIGQEEYITAVKNAIANRNKELLDTLIKPKLLFQPQKPDLSYIDMTINTNNIEALDTLIQAGADLKEIHGRPFWERLLQPTAREKAIPSQFVDILFKYSDKIHINGADDKKADNQLKPIEMATFTNSPCLKNLLNAKVKLSGPSIKNRDLPFFVLICNFWEYLPVFKREYKQYFKKTEHANSILETATENKLHFLLQQVLNDKELKSHLDINEQGGNGLTLLQTAISTQDFKSVEILISHGADCKEAGDLIKETISQGKYIELVKDAIKNTSENMLNFLIKPKILSQPDKEEKSFAELAIESKNPDLLEKLIQLGARLDKSSGSSLLGCILSSQHSDDSKCSDVLFNYSDRLGINEPFAWGRRKIAPIEFASTYNKQSYIMRLLKAGAKLSGLHINSSFLHYEIFRKIYASDLRIFTQNEEYKTYFKKTMYAPSIPELALNRDDFDLFNTILTNEETKKLIDPNEVGTTGKTLVECTIEKFPGDPRYINTLITAGVDLNAIFKAAVKQKKYDLIGFLLKDKRGLPPIDQKDQKDEKQASRASIIYDILAIAPDDRTYFDYLDACLDDRNFIYYIKANNEKYNNFLEYAAICADSFDRDRIKKVLEFFKNDKAINAITSKGVPAAHLYTKTLYDKEIIKEFISAGADLKNPPLLEFIVNNRPDCITEFLNDFKDNNNIGLDEKIFANKTKNVYEYTVDLPDDTLLDQLFAAKIPFPPLEKSDIKTNGNVFHKIFSRNKKYLPALLNSKNIAGYLSAKNIETRLLKELTLLTIRQNSKEAAEILVALLKSDDIAPIFNELRDVKNDAYNILRKKKEIIDLTTQFMTALQTDIDCAPAQAAISPASQFYCTLFSSAAPDEKKGDHAALTSLTIRDAMRLIEEKLEIKIESRHIVFEKVIHQCLISAKDYKDHFGNLATLYHLAYDVSQLRHDWIASKIKKDNQVLDKFKLIQTVIDTVDAKNHEPIDSELYRNCLNEDLKQVPEKEREEYRTKLNKILAFRALEIKTQDIISSYNRPHCKNVAHIVNDIYGLLENRYNPGGLFEKTSHGWFDDASSLIEALLKKIGTMEYIKSTGQKFKPR